MYAIIFADGSYCKELYRGVKRILIWNKARYGKTKITYEKYVFGSSWWSKEHPEMLEKWENAKVVEIEYTIHMKEV